MTTDPRSSLPLLCLLVLGVMPACVPAGVVATIRNGGDAPPFADYFSLYDGDLGSVHEGDTIAICEGNFEQILCSNETAIVVLDRGRGVPSERAPTSKAHGKGKGHKAARKQGKGRGKAEVGKSKNSPFLEMVKLVRRSGTLEDETEFAEMRLWRNDDYFDFSLTIMNAGKRRFAGDISLYDCLAGSLLFVEDSVTLHVVRPNGARQMLMAVPGLGPIGQGMSETVTRRRRGLERRSTTSFHEGLLLIDLADVVIPRNHGIRVEFQVMVDRVYLDDFVQVEPALRSDGVVEAD